MYFGQFSKKLSEQKVSTGIKSQLRSYGQLIEETVDGSILINGKPTELDTLEEARQYIIQQEELKKLEEEVKSDLYEDLSDIKIASIIQEQHNIKVTDTLIESYKELASSKVFTLDPVVHELKLLNRLDRLVENKFDYVLNDNTVIAISETTQHKLNSLFQGQQDVVEYMRESKENFLAVIKNIGE